MRTRSRRRLPRKNNGDLDLNPNKPREKSLLVPAQEEQKKEVSEEWHRKAQQMADEAYAHRLNELKMSGHDEQEQLDGDFTGLGSIGISNWYIMG